jgi:hypothetical protein
MILISRIIEINMILKIILSQPSLYLLMFVCVCYGFCGSKIHQQFCGYGFLRSQQPLQYSRGISVSAAVPQSFAHGVIAQTEISCDHGVLPPWSQSRGYPRQLPGLIHVEFDQRPRFSWVRECQGFFHIMYETVDLTPLIAAQTLFFGSLELLVQIVEISIAQAHFGTELIQLDCDHELRILISIDRDFVELLPP